MMSADPSSINTDDCLLDRDIYDNPLTNPKIFSISTKYGYVTVTQQGPPDHTALVTYHDVGYNSTTEFHHFFAFPDMMPITENFTIYHINAPGQEDRANPLPNTSIYPTMDQLAETINDVFIELNITSAIGFGVGLGANVLVRFALKYSTKIYGLILINCISRGIHWLEGFSVKWPKHDIPERGWTDSLMNYLIWYHLGPESQAQNPDLVNLLRRHLEENLNAKNVIKLLNAFLKRTPLQIEKPNHWNKNPKTLKCAVMHITGSSSPHKDDVISTNDLCNPATTSYVEFADCGGAVLDEQPAKLAESIRLFLQGLGYMSHLSIPRYSTANRLAEQTAEYKRRHGSLSKVPRRCSSQIDFGDYDQDDTIELEEELQLRANSLVDGNV